MPAYFAARVCERYGQTFDWWDGLPVEKHVLYLAQERIRIGEEEREVGVMAGGWMGKR